ncbi:uncharacterized protein LOC121917940 isoform X1 [Sceloporus undulatus]|uniref:uncharacterized protein LOC121917940 isoform X1 n=1 Tax=Sceloporus undulatus TaxID=8520 RepID=UPI001C4AA52C|nr:uncharacterized protein LOC121917940 isoform X1 [Sceloporus undulatus]
MPALTQVLQMRKHLQEIQGIARDNLREAQQAQKEYFDRRVKERKFTVGQRVLVFLPAPTNKWFAQWQGPFEVVRQVGPVDYEIQLGGPRARRQIFHVNLLKAWREREALWAEETEEEGSEPDEDLGAGWEDAGTHQELPVMTPLSSHQQQQGPWMLDRPSTLLTGGSCKEKREEGRVERARGGLQDPGEREDRPGKEEDQLDPRRESETPPWGWEGATGGLIRRKGEAKGGRRFGGRWRRGERDGEGKAEGYSAAEGEKVTREGGGPGTRVRVGPVLATHPACARRREGTQAQPWNLGIGQEGEGARGGEESWWAVRERRRLLGSHASPAPRDEGESSVEDYRPARPSTL